MAVHEIEPRYQYEKPVRVVKRRDTQSRESYIESHELSLLSLLVRKHPERAKEFLERLKTACEPQHFVV